MKKIFKVSILILLFSLISLNFYSSTKTPDQLTQYKSNFFKIKGDSHFLAQLDLWYHFASKNDWQNASKFELDLNKIELFKLNNQPEKIKEIIVDLQNKDQKDAQDYLKLAQLQSLIGLDKQATESIKQAHQLDPIRSDLDKLFYSVTNF